MVEIRNVKKMINKKHELDILDPSFYYVDIYGGCLHLCLYCPYRLNIRIVVKKNMFTLLNKELKKNKQRIPIFLGMKSDPYFNVESEYKCTHSALQIFFEYKQPIIINTKNILVLRDIEPLKRLNEYNLVTVTLPIYYSISFDPRHVEKSTSSINKRMQVLKTLRDNNIPTGLILYTSSLFSPEDKSFQKILVLSKKYDCSFIVSTNKKIPPILKEEYNIIDSIPVHHKDDFEQISIFDLF